MLSTKKLFTEHLLTLVLTLSLLRIDPENVLDLQWGGRLARVGDAGGWQLELLAAGPDYSNQSYVNRKFLPPIIEDLSRFERPFIEQNHRGLQTYLLNVLDANDDGTTAGTIAEERPPSPVPAVASGGVGASMPAAHNATMDALTNLDVDAEDIFLSANLFEETTSVFEQNMADLSEYDTILLENPMLKFDTGASMMPDLEGTIMRARSLMNTASEQASRKQDVKPDEEARATTSSSATTVPSEGSGVVRGNKTRAYHDQDDDDDDSEDEQDSKEAVRRQLQDQINTQQKHLVSTDVDSADVKVKTEPASTNDTIARDHPARAATPDLTQEVKWKVEMDLIEVLWKQDVDLGFTLANAGLAATSTANSNAPEGTSSCTDTASATNIKCDSEDDLEKLKVLLEIKNDKNADYEKTHDAADESSLVDPWAGLSYTIDTETGRCKR
uniref:Uncharacterized protein n=1 Tax=Anopheles epiroticus TaxID=199890 RepID=A0A182PJ21_9DIPT